MKNIRNISLFIVMLMLVALNSCKKDFDPVLPGSLPLDGSFPASTEDWTSYTMQVYIPINPKWGYTFFGTGASQEGYTLFQPDNSLFSYYDGASDQCTVFSGWGAGGDFYDSQNFNFKLGYENAGRGNAPFEKTRFITRYTALIDQLEKKCKITNDSIRKQLKGEAYMARGLMMFYELYIYGPIPVIMDAAKIGDPVAESDMTRPTRAQFVSWIESDLKTAADSLRTKIPSSEDGRFTKGAALTFLMRLYLMEHNYSAAVSVGKAIKNLNAYTIQGVNYHNNFLSSNTKLMTPEEIWAITTNNESEGRSTNPSNMNALIYYLVPGNAKTNPGWSQVFAMPWNIYNSFEAGDSRKQWLLESYINKDGGIVDSTKGLMGAIIYKYTPDLTGKTFQANDIVVCRYADVLLMNAEAINGATGPNAEAIADVNAVRSRAGLPQLTAAETSDQASFMKAIFRERTHEIWFETQRRLDLIRFNNWNTQAKAFNDFYEPRSNKIVGQKKLTSDPIFPIPNYAVGLGCGQSSQYGGSYTEALPSYYNGNSSGLE
jgi:hypothetical protein